MPDHVAAAARLLALEAAAATSKTTAPSRGGSVTSEFEKWARQVGKDHDIHSAHVADWGDWLVRAAFAEVERRVDNRPNGMPVVQATFRVFQELKAEWFGEGK